MNNRLKPRQTFEQLAANFIIGVFGVCIFFGAIQIATLQEERAAINDALDARARAESKLQRAARGVCNDHPERAGRTLEPVWTERGVLECQVVLAQEGGAQ